MTALIESTDLLEAAPAHAELDTQKIRSPYVTTVKPVVDRVVGTMLLIAVSPILAVAGILVAKEMGRPIFFTQQRIGKDGEPFTMYKFRSMLPDRRSPRAERTGTAADRGKGSPSGRTGTAADRGTGIAHADRDGDYGGVDRRKTHKSDQDPRHTKLGRFLRKTSIDELPQFWNVMRGEMSLVGPRPELQSVVETRYTDWQNQRHLVKPGLTGMWQVTARADGRLMLEDTQCDLDYIEQVSLLTDLRILLATPMVLLGRGGGR